ncbi:MAG TPA: hypothetical protein P5180_11800 [Bacteroidales bacterium]|nr:hypothetical protein [Bacteroidales bacterium]HRW86108.1 hypothetical protein [Bacteroidales bacterium]
MKKLLLSLPLLMLAGFLKGQAPFPSGEEIKQFSVSKTCVVLEEDLFSAYNVIIRDAMKQFWSITPFEFIDVGEFNTRNTDRNYSFIVLTETNYQKDKTGSVYKYINLLQGKRVEKLGQMPEICAVPLAYAGEDDVEYGYKLGAILQFMQKHASLIMEDPSKTGRKYLRYYNENIPRLKGKTILVMEKDLSPQINSPEKIKAYYSGNIEVVGEDEIIKATENKTPGVVILHKVGPEGEKSDMGYCFKMLIGADDAEMYYYDMHTISKANPNGLLPADLKRIGK